MQFNTFKITILASELLIPRCWLKNYFQGTFIKTFFPLCQLLSEHFWFAAVKKWKYAFPKEYLSCAYISTLWTLESNAQRITQRNKKKVLTQYIQYVLEFTFAHTLTSESFYNVKEVKIAEPQPPCMVLYCTYTAALKAISFIHCYWRSLKVHTNENFLAPILNFVLFRSLFCLNIKIL